MQPGQIYRAVVNGRHTIVRVTDQVHVIDLQTGEPAVVPRSTLRVQLNETPSTPNEYAQYERRPDVH